MSEATRYCPECETRTAELLCPKDGTQTVSEANFAADEVDPLVGRVFANRYRIEGVIGRGGMGSVYQATQLSMGRTMAVKMLHPDLAKTREFVRRFYREAKAASGLDSPHVVRIFDFGLDDDTGRSFMAMELLKGSDLSEHIEHHGAMSVRRACDVLAQAGRALIEAHAAGLVHRDLKPDNIHLQRTSDGADFVKVMDFGIAKFLKSAEEGNTDLTGTGMTLGTAAYMAPEQVRGEPVDFRADLYAMGGILHELLTGETPFVADTRMQLMLLHMTKPAPELPEVDVAGTVIPKPLRVLHQSLLAKHRYERPGTSTVVVDILKAVARGDDIDAEGLLAAQHHDEGDGLHTKPLDSSDVAANLDTAVAPKVAPPAPAAEPRPLETAAGSAWPADGHGEPGSKRVLLIAMAAVVLLGWGGLGAWFVLSGDEVPPVDPIAEGTDDEEDEDDEATASAAAAEASADEAAPTQPAPTRPAAAAAPVENAAPAEAAPTGQVAEPAAEPKPAPKPEPKASTTIVIRATPGATVKDGTETLGETPFALAVPAEGAARKLTLVKAGYKAHKVTVEAGATEDVDVVLTRKARARPKAKKKEGSGSGKW